MENLIIVEVGTMEDGRTPSYQFYKRLSNGTYRLAVALPDGQSNTPMFLRDARSRKALMFTVKAYGGAEEELE